MNRYVLLLPLMLSACAPQPSRPAPTADVGATVEVIVRATLTAVPRPTVAPTATVAPSPTPTARFSIGANAWVGIAAPKLTFVGADDRAVGDYLKAAQANDIVGVLDLEAKKRGFTVSPGVHVLVLDTAYNGDLVRVRILEGPKAPQDGWVPEEWLDTSPPG